MLTKANFHSSGNQLLYNGMTGDQLQADIYIGPTYYMRLKHMVKDKINYRALGPRTALTRQTVQGRSNDGGLRIGEMERDAIISHGASYFLNESFLVRGDEYYMAVCNKTGMIAIYNSDKNIFLSPSADGPVKFHTTMDGKMNLEMISKYGRSFSLLRIPYSLKLLIQELQVMNIQMRIITDENVDNLMSMSYSDNIINVAENSLQLEITPDIAEAGTDNITQYANAYKRTLQRLHSNQTRKPELEPIPAPVADVESVSSSTPYAPYSSSLSEGSYNPSAEAEAEVEAKTESPGYPPEEFQLRSPSESPPSLPPSQSMFLPRSPSESPPSAKSEFASAELNELYTSLPLGSQRKIDSLSKSDQSVIMKELLKKKKLKETTELPNILSIETETKEKEEGEEEEEEGIGEKSGSNLETKTVAMNVSPSEGETKKINL